MGKKTHSTSTHPHKVTHTPQRNAARFSSKTDVADTKVRNSITLEMASTSLCLKKIWFPPLCACVCVYPWMCRHWCVLKMNCWVNRNETVGNCHTETVTRSENITVKTGRSKKAKEMCEAGQLQHSAHFTGPLWSIRRGWGGGWGKPWNHMRREADFSFLTEEGRSTVSAHSTGEATSVFHLPSLYTTLLHLPWP